MSNTNENQATFHSVNTYSASGLVRCETNYFQVFEFSTLGEQYQHGDPVHLAIKVKNQLGSKTIRAVKMTPLVHIRRLDRNINRGTTEVHIDEYGMSEDNKQFTMVTKALPREFNDPPDAKYRLEILLIISVPGISDFSIEWIKRPDFVHFETKNGDTNSATSPAPSGDGNARHDNGPPVFVP